MLQRVTGMRPSDPSVPPVLGHTPPVRTEILEERGPPPKAGAAEGRRGKGRGGVFKHRVRYTAKSRLD